MVLLFLLVVGSLLGLGRGILSLALFFEIRLPGGVVVDGVDRLDVVVELLVDRLGGSQVLSRNPT